MFAKRRALSFVVLLCTFPALHGEQAVSNPRDTRRAQIAARISQYDRSIQILQTGLNQNWTAERYAKAFRIRQDRKLPGTNFASYPPCEPQDKSQIQPRPIWDELPPFGVEVLRTLQACKRERDLLVSIQNSPITAINTVK